jgi:uncharacterized membrane protein (DUF485 family)
MCFTANGILIKDACGDFARALHYHLLRLGVCDNGTSRRWRVSNARIGTILLLVYLVFYGGFMLLNTFQPEVMDQVPALGVNLAVWYGFGLIVLALVLALVYMWLCRDTSGREGRP